MICEENTFTIYYYHLFRGDYKDYKDLRGVDGVPIDHPNFSKMIEFAMKIKVLFNECGKTSYSIYRQKNNYGRYFWKAQKRVNCKLRQVYIGYNLPDRSKLAEIAEVFRLSEIEYQKYKRAIAKNKKGD